MPKFHIQSIIVKKIFARSAIMPIVRHFIVPIEYDPGVGYHHFIARRADEFKRIRTFTPPRLPWIKFKYGPLKRRD